MTRRVLHVVPADLARGAQTHARALCDELNRRGEDHNLVTLFRGEAFVLRPDHALDTPSGVLRRAGLDPRAALRLRRLVRRWRPDAVIAHGGEALKYAVFAVPPRRLVYLKIGTSSGVAGPAQRWLYRMLVKRCGLVAAISDDAGREAVELFGAEPSRVRVVPNGRDATRFAVRTRHDGPPRVVFVGHFTASKRPDVFVDLVQSLRGHVDFDALMVGDGPELLAIQPRADSAHIECLGRRDDVPEILSSADVFVFTSRSEGEGMPGVLIEAGLAGLATVTTKVPGATTVVEDGVTGFVVAIDDAAALHQAAERLISDESLRELFGAAARRRCINEFTIEASATRLSEALEDLR